MSDVTAAAVPSEPEVGQGEDRWIRLRWKYHVFVLSFSAAVLTVALVLGVGEQSKVTVPVIGKLPGICAWKRAFDVDCPGCGLTRSFISLAHGDIGSAWHFNPAGLLMFAVLLYQFPYRIIQLWRLKHGQPDYRHGVWTVNILVWGIILALLAQWTWRQLF